MSLQNGAGNKLIVPLLAGVCTFLAGIVVGDMRGEGAARTAEERVNQRIDREYRYIQQQLDDIKARLPK